MTAVMTAGVLVGQPDATEPQDETTSTGSNQPHAGASSQTQPAPAQLSLAEARQLLDAEHYGLDKVCKYLHTADPLKQPTAPSSIRQLDLSVKSNQVSISGAVLEYTSISEPM